MKKLIVLSESCPDDIGEIMPPSISGLVYNQVPLNTSIHATEGSIFQQTLMTGAVSGGVEEE